jgi:hypothetical protein
MCDTKYNIGMTRSNVKSPKFLSEKLSTFEGRRISVIKATWFKILLRNVITTKKPSQRGLNGRLQDYD